MLLVFSALLAAGGAVFPTPQACPAGVGKWRHFSTLVHSIWITALSAVLYA
jgi:hypothetical protein